MYSTYQTQGPMTTSVMRGGSATYGASSAFNRGSISTMQPAGGVYTHHQSTATVTMGGQRYQPAGCVPVSAFSLGIPPLYNISLVPAFEALPVVHGEFHNYAAFTSTSTTTTTSTTVQGASIKRV